MPDDHKTRDYNDFTGYTGTVLVLGDGLNTGRNRFLVDGIISNVKDDTQTAFNNASAQLASSFESSMTVESRQFYNQSLLHFPGDLLRETFRGTGFHFAHDRENKLSFSQINGSPVVTVTITNPALSLVSASNPEEGQIQLHGEVEVQLIFVSGKGFKLHSMSSDSEELFEIMKGDKNEALGVINRLLLNSGKLQQSISAALATLIRNVETNQEENNAYAPYLAAITNSLQDLDKKEMDNSQKLHLFNAVVAANNLSQSFYVPAASDQKPKHLKLLQFHAQNLPNYTATKALKYTCVALGVILATAAVMSIVALSHGAALPFMLKPAGYLAAKIGFLAGHSTAVATGIATASGAASVASFFSASKTDTQLVKSINKASKAVKKGGDVDHRSFGDKVLGCIASAFVPKIVP